MIIYNVFVPVDEIKYKKANDRRRHTAKMQHDTVLSIFTIELRMTLTLAFTTDQGQI